LTTKLSTNGVLAAAGLLFAGTLTVIALVPSFLAAIAALVLSGLAWMAVTSTLQAELQLMLPAWVRARGVAVYLVTFTGAQTGGALLSGLVANRVGLVPAILAAAIVVLAAALAGLPGGCPRPATSTPQPAVYWTDPRLA
jgi:hypothetical protein